jgi:4-diphosphocytidyl-2-C-methyl-D-erythritol kinase
VNGGVRFRTNAKINLFLRVFGLRPDGYHEVETILHGIGLSDDFEIRPTRTGQVEIDVHFAEGVKGQAPALKENVVYRAAQALMAAGGHNPGVSIRVVKRIPPGAGLGGGSGNAAGALVILSELWGLELDRDAMYDLAAGLGSDVGYCLEGGTALATSRGEELTTLPAPVDMWFVLGISNDPLLTVDVYEAWDAMGGYTGDEASGAAMTLALGAGDVREVASLLHNDLERVAFELRTDLKEKKEAMLRAGALGASVTGSGPTIYGVASDEAHARTVAHAVEADFESIAVVKSQARCIERLE